jgi:S1-C subfamily serine protease
MKHSLRTIIGFFAFCSLVVICFIFYTSHMAEKTSSVILGDDLKKTLAMNKEKEPSIETEGLRELEKAIALDKKSENEKVSHDKTIELEKKINLETNSNLSETSGKEVTRKKLLDEVRKGVVAIQVKSHASIQNTLTGQAWSGTGFIVSLENGLIATNHHVAGDMAVCTYEVKFSDGTTTTAKLKFFDPLLDFAFLTIDPKDFPASSIALEISKTPVKLNDTIYSMGNSAGDEFSTYKGTVFEIYETLGAFSEQSFKFSGLTVGGASGSPVFGENGKVVGIIYGGKFVSGAALPINYIARALDSLNKGNIPNRQSLGLVLRYNDLKDAVNVGVIPLEAATEYNKKFPMSHNKILVVETRMVNSHAESQLMAGDVIWKAQGEMIGPELAKFDEIIDSTVDLLRKAGI